MEAAHNAVPLIHYFDPVGHRIACGVPGFDKSTKHSRAVTCPSCVEALRSSPHAAPVADAGHGR